MSYYAGLQVAWSDQRSDMGTYIKEIIWIIFTFLWCLSKGENDGYYEIN